MTFKSFLAALAASYLLVVSQPANTFDTVGSVIAIPLDTRQKVLTRMPVRAATSASMSAYKQPVIIDKQAAGFPVVKHYRVNRNYPAWMFWKPSCAEKATKRNCRIESTR